MPKTPKALRAAQKNLAPARASKNPLATPSAAVADAPKNRVAAMVRDAGAVTDPRSSLSLKERRFVLAYVGEARGNATEAVRLAGFDVSEASSHVIGYRMLRKVHVRAAIDRIFMREVASSAKILKELHDQADKGHLIDSECMYDEEGYIECEDERIFVKTGRRIFDRAKAKALGLSHLVKKVTRNRYGDTVEVYDRSEALKLLANYRGLLSERIRIESREDLSKLSTTELLNIANGKN